jgi:hypothetical protein
MCIFQRRLETPRELAVFREETEASQMYRLIKQRHSPTFAIGNYICSV